MERTSKSDIAKAYKKAFLNNEVLLKDLAAVCHVNHTTFVPGDSHATAFREGMRSVYVHIQHYLQVDPKTLEESRG